MRLECNNELGIVLGKYGTMVVWEILFGVGLYTLFISSMYYNLEGWLNFSMGFGFISVLFFVYGYGSVVRTPRVVNNTIQVLDVQPDCLRFQTFSHTIFGMVNWASKYVTIPNEEFAAARSEYPIKDPKNIKEEALVLYYQVKEYYVLPEFFDDQLMTALKL